MKFKLLILFVIILILFCHNTDGDEVSCLDYGGKDVDWWFIFSKQHEKSKLKNERKFDNVGYYYIDSNGFHVDVTQVKEKVVFKSNIKALAQSRPITELIQQHTDKAFHQNAKMFQACTQADVIGDYADCEGAKATQEFVSQTWFHDTIPPIRNIAAKKPKIEIEIDLPKESDIDEDEESGIFIITPGEQPHVKVPRPRDDNTDTGEPEPKKRKLDEEAEAKRAKDEAELKAFHQLQEEKKLAKFNAQSRKAQKNSDRDDLTDFTKKKKEFFSTQKVMTEATYGPQPDSFRFAHSKFLVSISSQTNRGYILDHSVNLPSGLERAFEKPEPFFIHEASLGEKKADGAKETTTSKKEEPDKKFKKNSYTNSKFSVSQHFFCFNFPPDKLDNIVALLYQIKPRYVKSNYIDSTGESLVQGNLNLYQAITGVPLTNDNKCSNFYNQVYVKAVTDYQRGNSGNIDGMTANDIFGTLLNTVTNVATLVNENCLKYEAFGNGASKIELFGFRARNFPKGYYRVKDKEIHKKLAKQPSSTQMCYPYLTVGTYGYDAYTLAAMHFGGNFYSSTYGQSKKANIPSISTPNFQLITVKQWKNMAGSGRSRHEKMIFGINSEKNTATTKNVVCVGDGNRNLVHSLYTGLLICFKSEALTKYFTDKVDLVSTTNAYTFKTEFLPKLKEDPEESTVSKPTFIQTLMAGDTIDANLYVPEKLDDIEQVDRGSLARNRGKPKRFQEVEDPPKRAPRKKKEEKETPMVIETGDS
ncbi:deoxyribonuclease II [Tieghemostelium lacteum]|uniref:Deoxyribonuclease II n=1 Tax=Tieghemostelium lacteum TaxID=361077 RepID=A0A151Z8Q7_TIELA|nr:deoxyribonuclease II [Tieghemostelium lacteum]|eukprot:KYQ90327.1 deoxyribonuclease II [Tieghemostelium lacteum]